MYVTQHIQTKAFLKLKTEVVDTAGKAANVNALRRAFFERDN
jgi:hypothetical protein